MGPTKNSYISLSREDGYFNTVPNLLQISNSLIPMYAINNTLQIDFNTIDKVRAFDNNVDSSSTIILI
jgi:hypothetical protein